MIRSPHIVRRAALTATLCAAVLGGLATPAVATPAPATSTTAPGHAVAASCPNSSPSSPRSCPVPSPSRDKRAEKRPRSSAIGWQHHAVPR